MGTPENNPPKLNCIAEVIEREYVSSRALAQRLGMTVAQVLASSKPANDLRLSELYRWQSVLQVPIAELLVEVETPLSLPVTHRSELLKTMRTVRSIQERAKDKHVQAMALRLVEQLQDMMPELNDVAPRADA